VGRLPDADNFLYPLFYSGSAGPGGNYAFYAEPGTDSLILRARRTTNDTARTTLYRRIDERVYRAAPWLYLWFPTDLWARRPELVGGICRNLQWTALDARTGRAAVMHLVGRRLLMTLPTLFASWSSHSSC